jgi:hypothetical protein
MGISNQFINSLKLDDQKRIVIVVQPPYQHYLQSDKNKQFLKKGVMDTLKEDFLKLEVGKNGCRITVKKGTEEKNLKLAENEIVSKLEMAMKFLNMMG